MSGQKTFTNPILPAPHPDPWVVFKDGYYYYCGSEADRSLYVIRSKTLTGIANGDKVTVWHAPEKGEHSRELWAPELHWIDDRWYIYYAADDGKNENHRMFVLQSTSDDPQGEFVHKGKITDPADQWAIDGTVLETRDRSLYFVWSGWEGDVNEAQHLYIAPMSREEPWKITGERVKLSSPNLPWERIGFPYVNEGPQILKRNDKIHVIYSASGSWTEDYCLGRLTIEEGKDVLNPIHWEKGNEPVFVKNASENVYGVGHAGFTKSPDGTEDWIVYHGMDNPDAGWDGRSARAQVIAWNEDDLPEFGQALGVHRQLSVPAGE